MCGILAIASARPLDPDLPDSHAFRSALNRLAPRGPDARGAWRSPDALALLGHTRLAVQDLSDAGAQPMRSSDGLVALTYNGEIYNAPDLRRKLEGEGHRFRGACDTEVLLLAYEAWGIETALDRVEGMFSFVVWDGRTRTLHAAVDPVGQKPLCFARQGDRITLASDSAALRRALPEATPLSYTGLCHVLRLGSCPAPQSVWRGVEKLGPGQRLTWTPDAGVRRFTYWQAPSEIDGDRSREPFAELLTRVVGEHLHSDVPLGLLLSAGTDSSAIALAMRDAGASPACLTLAMPGDDDESPEARDTALALGLTHESVALTAGSVDDLLRDAAVAFDEPSIFGALLTQTAVSRAARARAKVVLTGDGGDEAFSGYAWHSPPPEDNDSLAFVSEHTKRVMPWFSAGDAATLLEPLRAPGESVYSEQIAVETLLPHDRPSLPSPRRAQRLDLLGFCAGTILPKVDRASMAVGLEMRSPLLDRRVIEWGLSRPPVAGEPPKAPLREFLRGRVPGRTLERPKQGFSLRLGDPLIWHEHADRLDEHAFVRTALVPSWTDACAPGTNYAHSRAYAMTFLARWAEAHDACGSV